MNISTEHDERRPGSQIRARNVIESLRFLRRRAERLERRQRCLWLGSVVVCGVLSLRSVGELLQLHPGSSVVAPTVLVALGFAGTFAGLLMARRWESHAIDCRQQAFWLELASAAIAHREIRRGHPYRGEHPLSDSGQDVLMARSCEIASKTPPSAPSFRGRSACGVWPAAAGTALAIAVGVMLIAMLYLAIQPGETRRWMFTESGANLDELGLRAPVHDAGPWLLTDDHQATGGRALVNFAGLNVETPALALATAFRSRDLRIATRCKVAAHGRSCGLVFRLRDEGNYYVAYLDVVAREVCLAAVVAGRERTLQCHHAGVAPGVWQVVGAEARGDDLRVSWNGVQVIHVDDSTHLVAGEIGLWVPSSDEAFFDELTVDAAPVGPRS